MENIQDIINENKYLRQENLRLRQTLEEVKNWPRIREVYLVPSLDKVGVPRHMQGYIISAISSIIKEMLGIKKVTEVNGSNYELVKDMATSLVEVLTKFEYRKDRKQWESI